MTDPPPLDSPPAGRRARSRCRLAAVAAVGCVVVLAGVVAIASAADDQPDPRRELADPVTTQAGTSTRSPRAVAPPPVDDTPVRLSVDPATIGTAGGPMQLTITNASGAVVVGCDLPRLDRWDGARWVAIGWGFDASLPPDATPRCPPVQIATGRNSPRNLTLPPSGIGLYRWVLKPAVAGGEPEARFTVRDEVTDAPGGPPPIEGIPDLELTLDPAILPPGGRKRVRLTGVNHTQHAIGWGGMCGDPAALDRWDGTGWRPLGDGVGGRPGVVGGGQPTGRDCESDIGPGERGVMTDLSVPALESGWYRWRQLFGMPANLVPAEVRFTVGTADDPPEPLAGSATVWLAGGERLGDPHGLSVDGIDGSDDALVIDGTQLALTWTTQCNEPLAAVVLDVRENDVIVLPLFSGFPVTDCLGEPSGPWSTVVDLPPLEGRKVVMDTEEGPKAVRVATSSRRVGFGPLGRDGVPAAVRPPVRVGNGYISLQWHGRQCDTVANAEMIVIEGIAYPQVRATGPSSCPADPSGHFAAGTYKVPSSFDALSVIGAPPR